MKYYYVVYRTSYTMHQVGDLELCKNKKEAEKKAKEYNKSNQDKTWNHIVAEVVCSCQIRH